MKKKLILAACIGAYLVSPYVALYGIGSALRAGDVRTLTADIAWDPVREGLKEDIADGITGQPRSTTQAADELPAFGAGFMTSMAANVVDRTVTPEHLAESLNAIHFAGAREPSVSLSSAWFTGPTSFEATFRLPSEQPSEPPVRVRMELVKSGWGVHWCITRAWIPTDVLTHMQTSAS
jgi:hypothetical protein